MVLVAGATGILGREICAQLIAAGKEVRALVRPTADPTKVAYLADQGAKLASGDLRDRASLEAACQGVSAIISTASAIPFSYEPATNNLKTVDLEGGLNLVAAARAARVDHFIYISYSPEPDCPSRDAKRAVEQRLRESGMVYTILRPGNFMEIWLSPMVGFDVANARARIYGSGECPISWISLVDVAQFAVASLDNPAARNATIPLGGPEALSPLQVVKTFEAATARTFELEHVPEAALEAGRAAATDGMEQSMMAFAQCAARGDAISMDATLAAFPLRLKSVAEYAATALVTARAE